MLPGSGQGALNERATWMAAIFFAALTILLAYPISLHPIGLRFPTGPDGDLGWYILGWDAHAFLHRPWAIFDANIYYPERFTLAYGENVIGIALFAAPVIWLGGNLLLAANFVCLLSTALCGVAAYVLARRIGLSIAAAIICGIIFQCSPPRFLRIGQMNLSSVQWIPFTLAALHAYFETGRRRDLRLAALFISLQVLSSGHGAVFLAVTLVVFLGYRFALGEPLRPLARIRDLGFTGVLLLLPSILVFLPYRIVQREAGLKRGLGTWIANYESFLASPSHLHRYLLDSFGLARVNETAAAFLFPGYVPLILAAAALLWPLRHSRIDRRSMWSGTVAAIEFALFATTVVAAVLTLGTLVPLKSGLTQLVMRITAVHAWLACTAVAVLGALLYPLLPTGLVRRHGFALVAVLLAAGMWIGLTHVRTTMRAGDGLRGEYYSNGQFDGEPAFVASDNAFSRARLTGRWDGAQPEHFSVRWMGFLTVARSGDYYFSTTSDDGSELYIDRALVVSNSGIHPQTTKSGRIRLEQGSHLVVLKYSQMGGTYDLSWSWSQDGRSYTEIPSWLLSQRQTHYSTALTAHILDWVVRLIAMGLVALTAGYARAVLSGRGPALRLWAEPVRRNVTAFYGLLTFVTLWLSLGPPYGIWRYVYWLPGFSFIRVNTRFTIVALLGLAVLAGIGFDRLAARVTRTRTIALASVIGILLVAEFAAMPLPAQPSNFDVPSIDRWLNTLPKPFVVAEVPVYNQETQLGAFERQEVKYMIHSSAHWQKTVHGYSGWRTAFHSQLYWYMQSFPDDASVRSLSELGVNYIVVHIDAYRPDVWQQVEQRLNAFSRQLTLIHEESGGRVYRLTVPVTNSGTR